MSDKTVNRYIQFASNISFFEFIQEEFGNLKLNVHEYEKEIVVLSQKKSMSEKELVDILRKFPRVYDVLEAIVQLLRFTNTQITHFMYDISLINDSDIQKIYDYLLHNLENDKYFLDAFTKQLKTKRSLIKDSEFSSQLLANLDKKAVPKGQQVFSTQKEEKSILEVIMQTREEQFVKLMIYFFKVTIDYVIQRVSKNLEIIHNRIKNKHFVDVSERISSYLLTNYKLNDILKGIEVTYYLQNKRKIIDTKNIHGNFGHLRLHKILNEKGFICLDEYLSDASITTLNGGISELPSLSKFKGKFCYVSEKYCSGIIKRKDSKPKRFDFILLYDLVPKIVIETNFYSTSGTKIGINQGEYVDLNDDIKTMRPDIMFLWITDGNFWLSSAGLNKFQTLYTHFGNRILNYSLFSNELDLLKKELINKRQKE